jgi:transposase-like protein
MPPTSHDPGSGHLRCPFCTAYEVQRLYLGSLHLDSCECASCGARWDEEPGSGTFRGRAARPRS